MQVSARALSQLQAVFGDCVPKENAAHVLEHSPAAPASAAELQALRALLVDVAGKKLSELASSKATAHVVGAPASSSTHARAMPGAMSVQLQQVQARRDLAQRGVDGLQRVVTVAEARVLFDKIAGMKDVPHHFLEDGCVFRSHVVSKRLEDAGVFCEKVFAIPLGGDLIMDAPKWLGAPVGDGEPAPLGYTVCWYHEAVCVHVATDAGDVKRMVLDPSLGDSPMTVEEWRGQMSGTDHAPLETFVLPRFAFGLSARDNPPNAYVEDDLKDALEWCQSGWKEARQGYVEMGFYTGEAAKLAGRE